MNPLPDILARDFRIHRARTTGCFLAFVGAGASVGFIVLILLGLVK